MRRKSIILIAILFMINFNVFAAENVSGKKTFQPILLNGKNVEIGSYLINERNYLKLRDVAALLSGTGSQFNVDWDEATGNVIIKTGEVYVRLENDLKPLSDGVVNGVKDNINVVVNGELKKIETVLINENNYLQLRQLGEIAGFGVDWDEATSAILLTTNEKAPEVVEDKKASDYNALSKALINPNANNYNYSNVVSVGAVLPNFTFDTVDGSSKNIGVNQILKSDKIQLINFFRTDCPFCVKEIPDFVKANNKNNLEIVLISLNKDKADVKKMFDKNNYLLPVFTAADRDAIIKDYDLQVVPTSFFVKDGVVLGSFAGSLTEAQLNYIMSELNAGKSFPTNEKISEK